MMRFLVPVGRILFALIFSTHFSPEGVQHAAALGTPFSAVLVPISGLMAIVGGLSVVLGYKTRWGAWLLVAFLLPVTLVMHAFSTLHNPAAIHVQQAMFAKSLSMLGAALLIAHFGAGPVSIDSRKNPASE